MAFGWDDAMMGGLSLLSLLMGGGGGGQDRATFEGETGPGGMSIDPRDLLGQGIHNQSDVLQMIMENIGRGVQAPGAYAQAPPTMTGGGLPMPIGVTGRDPAVADPVGQLSLGGLHPKGQQIGPWATGLGPKPDEWNPMGGLWEHKYGPGASPTDGQPGGTYNTPGGRSTGPTTGGRTSSGPQATDDATRAANGRPPNVRAHGHGIDTTTGQPTGSGGARLRTNGVDLMASDGADQGDPHQEASAALSLLGIK